jgi:hypothetical protein
LITFERYRERGSGVILVGTGATALRVQIESTTPWTLRPELIEERLPGDRKPTRLGLALAEPVRTARVTVTIRPE